MYREKLLKFWILYRRESESERKMSRPTHIQETLDENDGKFPAFAWPGGYPLYYITKDSGVLCPSCANDNINLTTDIDDPQWYIVAVDANYEDDFLYCDHCGKQIESAYSDD